MRNLTETNARRTKVAIVIFHLFERFEALFFSLHRPTCKHLDHGKHANSRVYQWKCHHILHNNYMKLEALS